MRFKGTRVVRFDPFCDGDRMIEPIEDLVRDSWGEPDSQVEHWMKLAEWGFAAYDREERLVGVALVRHLREDVLWTIASVVDPDYQRGGITMRINTAPLMHLWLTRVRRSPLSAFRRVALVNRTSNPRVYRLLADRSEVFPHPDGREPEPDDLELLRAVCEVAGGPAPDEETFVIPGASLPYPGLIPKRGALPWSGDPAIDGMFRERVQLEDCKGHLLFMISRFGPHAPIWHGIKRQALRALRRRRLARGTW